MQQPIPAQIKRDNKMVEHSRYQTVVLAHNIKSLLQTLAVPLFGHTPHQVFGNILMHINDFFSALYGV